MKFFLAASGLVLLAALASAQMMKEGAQESQVEARSAEAETREARVPTYVTGGFGNNVAADAGFGAGSGIANGFGSTGLANGFGGAGSGLGGVGTGLGGAGFSGAGIAGGNGLFLNGVNTSLRACRFVDTLAALRTRAVQPLDDARRAVISLERYLDTISRVMNQIAIRNQCNIRLNHYGAGTV